MMTSNTLPTAVILSASNQNGPGLGPKIPFENSKTMDECRVQVLRKFKKELLDTVRFSDVSETLIGCGLVSKEECYEICKLSVRKQMLQCYQKVHDIMDILVCQKSMSASERNNNNNDNDTSSSKTKQLSTMEEKQKGLVKELWSNFIQALRKEHSSLATKMENELDKITENKLLLKRNKTRIRTRSRGKLRKEDIGPPTDFQHIQHYGLITRSKSEPVVVRFSKGSRKENQKRRQSLDEEKVLLPKVDELDEEDPDLQEFFKRAGVAERHLLDPVTRQIILRFIVENGGINAIREEVRSPAEQLPRESDEAEEKVCGADDGENGPKADVLLSPPPAPANVPFEPTPRPMPPNLFYF